MIDLKISINGTTQPIKKLVVEFYENGGIKTNNSNFNSSKYETQIPESNSLEFDRFKNVNTNFSESELNNEKLKEIEYPDLTNREAKVSNTMNEEF